MRKFRTAAAALAVSALAASAAAAAPGGVANAATSLPITSCNVSNGVLGLGVTPACTAETASIYNPTQITVSANTSFLTVLGALLPGLGVTVSYQVACVVDGSTVTSPTQSFTATALASSQVADLTALVGSPEPSQCQVENLQATSTLALILPGPLPSFTFGVQAVGNNGIPGTIWAQYPVNSVGSGSTVCTDDTANGNSGTAVQAYQCENDLAEQWILAPTGQLVHNGDCLTDSSGLATLANCEDKPSAMSSQVWTTPTGGAGEIVSADGDGCLTAPSSGSIDGAQLAVTACSAAIGQEWKVPSTTPL